MLDSRSTWVREIGAAAMIGHACVVHGATIGEEALIGNEMFVLDGASAPWTLVVAGSRGHRRDPRPRCWRWTPGAAQGPDCCKPPPSAAEQGSAQVYRYLVQRHGAGVREVWHDTLPVVGLLRRGRARVAAALRTSYELVAITATVV